MVGLAPHIADSINSYTQNNVEIPLNPLNIHKSTQQIIYAYLNWNEMPDLP